MSELEKIIAKILSQLEAIDKQIADINTKLREAKE